MIYATRIQRERMPASEAGEVMEACPARFRIDRKVITKFARKDTAVILHPLPRDSAPDDSMRPSTRCRAPDDQASSTGK